MLLEEGEEGIFGAIGWEAGRKKKIVPGRRQTKRRMASSTLLSDAWTTDPPVSPPSASARVTRVEKEEKEEEERETGDDDERRALRAAIASLRSEVAHRSTATMVVAFACLAIVTAYVEGLQRELRRLREETRRLR